MTCWSQVKCFLLFQFLLCLFYYSLQLSYCTISIMFCWKRSVPIRSVSNRYCILDQNGMVHWTEPYRAVKTIWSGYSPLLLITLSRRTVRDVVRNILIHFFKRCIFFLRLERVKRLFQEIFSSNFVPDSERNISVMCNSKTQHGFSQRQ